MFRYYWNLFIIKTNMKAPRLQVSGRVCTLRSITHATSATSFHVCTIDSFHYSRWSQSTICGLECSHTRGRLAGAWAKEYKQGIGCRQILRFLPHWLRRTLVGSQERTKIQVYGIVEITNSGPKAASITRYTNEFSTISSKHGIHHGSKWRGSTFAKVILVEHCGH